MLVSKIAGFVAFAACFTEESMRTALFVAAAVLLASTAAATAQAPREGASPDPTLVGTWQSAPEEIRLASDFDRSVWGPDASSVRTVELIVQRSGEATLKVTKKVVDAKGNTVPASTWVEDVQLRIGEARAGTATRVEHETAIVSAVRLFPDDPEYRWEIDGLRVKVVTFEDGEGDTIEIRYDTPEGRGSFWETLRRDGTSVSRRATR